MALDPRNPLIKADGDVGAAELESYKRHGYAAITYQAQNDTNLRDYDLQPARAAGLSPGVWGVSYEKQHFFRDGEALARQAVKLGAEHVTMDIEMALKNTRPGGAKPVIDGIRAGGWSGPVHLNTLGGPTNPKVTPNGGGNDYGFDYQSFLDTGGGVFLQCYWNMANEYHPDPSLDHAWACGVPRERLNATISLAFSESYAPKPSNRIPGSGWIEPLEQAGVKRNLSIFLARSILPGDLEALDHFTLASDPVKDLLDKLNLTNTGINAVLDRLETVFDKNDIPEPDGIDALRSHLLALGKKVNELVDAVNQL